ncbi:MAG: hypothetical protein CL843_06130 [Crocinitomicaceae bacterium]|nr:hypothetical protein [Crocinitomicaceae bacterium]|tara:strand:+ start:203 stop:415 length:213 start_codon:yes stop_codon:yes gene_type:complete
MIHVLLYDSLIVFRIDKSEICSAILYQNFVISSKRSFKILLSLIKEKNGTFATNINSCCKVKQKKTIDVI